VGSTYLCGPQLIIDMITSSAVRSLASPLRRSVPSCTLQYHPRTTIYTPATSSQRTYTTATPSRNPSMSIPAEVQDIWTRSDLYHNSHLIPQDSTLEYAVKNSDENTLPAIAVTAAQGKFLHLLARSIGAKRILEVGTLGGYSTIWLARALPEDGKLVTCELQQKHADVARKNLDRAGVSSKVEIIVGSATETLPKLTPSEPFDFAFIDADKENNAAYFIEARRLVKKGGVIIVDNVVRRGRVANTAESDPQLEGCRKLLRYIQQAPDVSATTIATVGEKGYDGFLYAVNPGP